MVACNSATVAAINVLREKYNIPFVGVEPSVKPAAKKSKTKEITVLATEKTLNSKREKHLLKNYAKGVLVRLYSAPEFVNIVEKGRVHNKETVEKIEEYFLTHPLGKSDILV